VAIFALRQGMGADQGEAVLVIPNSLQGNLPSFDGMAIGAVGAELALVDVGVAVGALGADVFEDHAGVTLGAWHFLMHGAQRIPGEIVIEIRIGADRFPTGGGVTIGARDRNGTVRIGNPGLRRLDADGYTGTAAGACGRIPVGVAF